jgi:hypothetical protein
MWRELIDQLTDKCEFTKAITIDQLDAAESKLGDFSLITTAD